MAQSVTGSRNLPFKGSSKSLPASPVRDTPPTLQGESTDRIAKYCCSLRRSGTDSHGRGFIVKLEGLRSAKLLALGQGEKGKTGEKEVREKRKKIGDLETEYALITSHDTIPGLSLSGLKAWMISCIEIKNGHELALSDLVCRVISCCGSESLFSGHTAGASILRAHDDQASCDIQLNITILFLNEWFAKLHMLQKSSVCPPTVSVEQCLDQEKYTREYEQIVRHTHFRIYHFDENRCVKTTPVSVVEWQATPEQSTAALSVQQQSTSEHQQVLDSEMSAFERLQKLELSGLVETENHGSPVVYINPATNESSVIGVHVGDTDKKGHCVVVTFHGILRLLQGGLIPVLSALRCLKVPKAWVSRWGYLVTPHIHKTERMDIGYLCEVLHYLLKKRLGTPLVKIPVDLVDKDNEASLDLLCALLKHFKNIDDADLNEAVTKSCLRSEIDGYIGKLCRDLIHLLELGIIIEEEKTSLVEKCCILYDIILDIKFTGVAETVLCTSNLLKQICRKYKHSAVVQEKALVISLKCLESLERLMNDQPPEKSRRTGVLGKRRLSDDTFTSSHVAKDGGLLSPSSGSTTFSTRGEDTETPQIKDLIDALYHEVADKWKIIGVLLEIPKGKLTSIAEKHHDPQNCLINMFEIWLERVSPSPTWVAIIEAVEFLGEEQLGRELREKYTP